jgi:hypothetical protein
MLQPFVSSASIMTEVATYNKLFDDLVITEEPFLCKMLIFGQNNFHGNLFAYLIRYYFVGSLFFVNVDTHILQHVGALHQINENGTSSIH